MQVGRWADILHRFLGADLDGAALAGDTAVAFTLGITAGVWLVGGIAQIVEMPEDWKRELSIAVAGPITRRHNRAQTSRSARTDRRSVATAGSALPAR